MVEFTNAVCVYHRRKREGRPDEALRVGCYEVCFPLEASNLPGSEGESGDWNCCYNIIIRDMQYRGKGYRGHTKHYQTETVLSAAGTDELWGLVKDRNEIRSVRWVVGKLSMKLNAGSAIGDGPERNRAHTATPEAHCEQVRW